MKNKFSKVKDSVKKPINKIRKKDSETTVSTKLPYITNETVAEHREEVLAGARKYIYPLQHSKHKIVWLSISIFLLTLVLFIVYSLLSLYKFQSTSTFTYRVTQIVPFPVARVDGRFVSYENYLFELRRNIHYYENQQKVNFSTSEGQEQLKELKKQSLDQVINDAYVKSLAEKNDVSVSAEELEKGLDLISKQDRLGSDKKMLEDVLRDYWGWSLNDFRRAYKQQVLARKVVDKLDTEAHAKANSALDKLKSGADFAVVASEFSDDEDTKANGGEYATEITTSSKELSAKVTEIVFAQQVGQYSNIINADYTLEIVKTLSIENGKARAAHIQINLKDIKHYIDEQKQKSSLKKLIDIPEVQSGQELTVPGQGPVDPGPSR